MRQGAWSDVVAVMIERCDMCQFGVRLIGQAPAARARPGGYPWLQSWRVSSARTYNVAVIVLSEGLCFGLVAAVAFTQRKALNCWKPPPRAPAESVLDAVANVGVSRWWLDQAT